MVWFNKIILSFFIPNKPLLLSVSEPKTMKIFKGEKENMSIPKILKEHAKFQHFRTYIIKTCSFNIMILSFKYLVTQETTL